MSAIRNTESIETLKAENEKLKQALESKLEEEKDHRDQFYEVLDEKLQLEKLVKELREENIRLHEKYLAAIGDQLFREAKKKKLVFPNEVLNNITSFNKSIYENTISVQFTYSDEVKIIQGQEEYVETKFIVAEIDVRLDKRLHKPWREHIMSFFKKCFGRCGSTRYFEFLENRKCYLEIGTCDESLSHTFVFHFECRPEYTVAEYDPDLYPIRRRAQKIVSCQLENITRAFFRPPETPVQPYVALTFDGKRMIQDGSFCGDGACCETVSSRVGVCDYKVHKVDRPPQDGPNGNFEELIYHTHWWHKLIRASNPIEVKIHLVNNKRLPLSKGLRPATITQ